MNQDLQWTQETWDHLNGLVSDEINAGLATKLLPHYDLGAVTTTVVPADVIVIDEHQGRIVEGKHTSIADLSAEVVLTEQQAYGGENATTIESLTIDRARRIKQVVDGITFQGSEIFQNPLFRTLTGTVTFRNAEEIVGLLDAAGGHVEVQPLDGTSEEHSQRDRPETPPRSAKKYGEHTFDAVKAAVSVLAGNGYERSTVLVLHTDEYADADTLPADTLVTPLERLEKLVTDGVYQSAMVPPSTGFLLAKSGSGVDLVWVQPRIEFVQKHGRGEFILRVVSRFVPRVKDSGSSIVRLSFR